MKKYILVLIILLGSFSLVKAQEDDAAKRAEKIQALKTAFITQKLKLTSAEAQKFWPVYGEYEADMRKLLNDKSSPDVIANEEKILNIRKKYRPEFEKVLGKPRMNKLFISEKEFRGILIKQLNKKGIQQPKNKGNQQRPPRNR